MIREARKKYGWKTTIIVVAALMAVVWFAYRVTIGIWLLHAAESGHVNTVERLLCIGAWGNSVDPELHTTPLMAASENGHEMVVIALLSHNADPNKQDEQGDTALILASANGYASVVKLLINAGATQETKNESGKTALDYAAEGNHPVIISLLKANGVKKKELR